MTPPLIKQTEVSSLMFQNRVQSLSASTRRLCWKSPKPPQVLFVLRFDLILDGDCAWRSQFDRIIYAVPAWLA
jgi:hypothetical protein